MSKNTININGEKLRKLLEIETGSSIYEIAESSGFSRNLIAEAIRKGKASPIVQMIAESCGLLKDDYILKESEVKEIAPGRQISIDDIEEDKREDLKALIKEACKEAIVEVINSQEYITTFDPHRQLFTIHTRIKEA